MVIGEGHALNACKSVVQHRGLGSQVRFMGRLPHEQAMGAIAECHVLVLPSLCLENCPMSLVEALAAGTNILTCDIGGMAELVQTSGVGFVFTPGDEHSLKRALDNIMAAHHEGRLNSFDASRFLTQRSDESYFEGLLQAYVGVAGRDPAHSSTGILSGAM